MSLVALADTRSMSQQAWLEVRRKGIGGSDIGAICGVNPWRSPIQVYMDKIGEAPEVEENDSMLFGKLAEPMIADVCAERQGYKIQRRNAILQHPDYPWALANVDRLIIDKKRGNGVLEVKAVANDRDSSWANEQPPAHYVLQLQWYLWVTGYKWGAFAVLIGGHGFKFCTYEMERDDALIEWMVERAKAFWKMVETNTPPEYDGTEASSQLVYSLYPESKPETIMDLPSAAEELIDLYQTATEEEKAWGERKEAAANQLKALLGENEVGLYNDARVSWKTINSKRLDTKALQKERPEIYAQYAKDSAYRRFGIKFEQGGM